MASLAPGRFRLGIGPSHQAGMEQNFGVEWRTPLRNLREYLIVISELLRTGAVDYQGKHVAKATAYFDGAPRHGKAENVHLPAKGLEKSEKDFHERGFAGAVGAEESYGAAFYGQGDVGKGLVLSVVRADRIQNNGAHRWGCPTSNMDSFAQI